MERLGKSLRHISHPKMYLAKIIWQLPKDKKGNKLIFQLKKRAAFLLLIRTINMFSILTTLPQKNSYIKQLLQSIT